MLVCLFVCLFVRSPSSCVCARVCVVEDARVAMEVIAAPLLAGGAIGLVVLGVLFFFRGEANVD